MGKKNKNAAIAAQSGAANPAPNLDKTTQASEIDDIFSSKSSRATAVQCVDTKGQSIREDVAQAGKVGADTLEGKKAKNKKRKPAEIAATAARTLGDRMKSKNDGKKTTPLTVVDSSTQLLSGPSRKRSKLAPAVSAAAQDDDDGFRDSRGTSNRKRTEEGFNVYTEHELGMNNEGGDTPLCPFDCECCF